MKISKAKRKYLLAIVASHCIVCKVHTYGAGPRCMKHGKFKKRISRYAI
jgi:hypothetical protein